MPIGSCRRCGLRPRRVRRGLVEPLCEHCYQAAMAKVARELTAEAGNDGRRRYRKFEIRPGRSEPDRPPQRVIPAARAAITPPEVAQKPGTREPRCVNEATLREARRLYTLGLSLRAVAEQLLDQTTYANARSAEVALRAQFRRRGWPLRSRRQAQTLRHRAARPATRRAA